MRNMGRCRKNDLKKAKEVLDALGLKSTAKRVEAMEEKVGRRNGILWSEMQAFLDTFENEAQKHSWTCKETFETMERILLHALDGSNTRTLSELQDRGLRAPPIDPHIDALDVGLSTINNELSTINNEVTATTRTQTWVLLLMFGHMVRWQALENFAKEWVGHWGRGLNDNLKDKGVEVLLTIKDGKQTPNALMSDSRRYRNAIAHGGFQFNDEHHVKFWTRDSRGKIDELLPLTSGDLRGLYNYLEVRIRTMEALGRVFRAWGRHASESK